MTGSWGSWPDDDHRRVPHEHVHLGAVDGWHAHVHRHDGLDEHSHVHVHAGGASGKAVPAPHHVGTEISVMAPAPRRHRPLLPDDHHDDEIGVLVTEGLMPQEAQGRHCRWCGEDIELSPADLPMDFGPFVIEYRHTGTGTLHSRPTVHCAQGWQGRNLVALAEETASPCWQPNCLSNSEHGAKQAGEQ